MKKVILTTLTILMPLTAMGSRRVGETSAPMQLSIPSQFSTDGEMKTREFGCPINKEQIKASTEKAAIAQLVNECSQQIRYEVEKMPEVVAVLQTSLIADNVTVERLGDNLQQVNGTIFIQVMVKEGR